MIKTKACEEFFICKKFTFNSQNFGVLKVTYGEGGKSILSKK